MQVLEYQEIDSTNIEAKRLIETGQILSCALVKTKLQTAGRGRLDRTWQNKEGNLAFSVVIPKKWVKNINFLPASVCVAVRNCISPNNNVKFKWPNDLLICKNVPAKFCGILIENCDEFFIVGIGVNVCWNPENVIYETTNLQKHAISIKNEEKIAKELLEILNKDVKFLKNEWEKYSFYSEKEVKINGNVGIFKGIDENFSAKILINEQLKLINYGDIF